MSFILDALKKSENDRQRQSGPALFEVRVPPPRSRFPLLAVAIVSLLVVNLGVVAWIMLRKPAAAATPQTQVAAITPAPPAFSAPPPAPYPQGASPQMAPGSAQPPVANTPPPAGYDTANGGAYPPPNSSGGTPSATTSNGFPAQNAAGVFARTVPAEPSLAEQGAEPMQGLNPDDYEPAHEPPPPGTGAGRASRSSEAGLPSYEEAATRMSIPPLHLDLHSYAPDPSKRFVLINMRRLYEGQSLPEGPKLESITTDAAILSYRGTKFVMDRD